MFFQSSDLINKVFPGYHNKIVDSYRFLMFDCRLAATPLKHLFSSVDKLGFEFFYKGDTVIWLWPWKRKNKDMKFISLGFSGDGSFGDAVYKRLKDLDRDWLQFEAACGSERQKEVESLL